jgi:hypothetical protein
MILGILVTLIAIFLLRVFRLFLSRFSNRTFNDVIPYLRPDHAEQLQEVLNRDLEGHLASNLGQHQFRQTQLKRIGLAQEYIGRRTHNVTILQEWGDTEGGKTRVTFNRDVRSAADKLVVRCAEFRIGASAVQSQLHIWHFKMKLLPSTRVPYISRLRRVDSFDLLESYEEIKEAALKLAEVCGGDYHERLASTL